MFNNFTEFNIPISPDVTIHGVHSPHPTTNTIKSLPPLLLLHGFPQTHHIWHKIAPSLLPYYTLIAIDLRGYGKSSKPPSSSSTNHSLYSKSTMASDCISIMNALNFPSKFFVLGHDRGARVAHKLCVDFPDRIEKVVLLDIAPTLAMYENTDMKFANSYFHWFFLIQDAPFPEDLILASPEIFARKFFGAAYSSMEKGDDGKEGKRMVWRDFFDQKAMEEYVKQFSDKEGVSAMCEDYRAAATIDLDEARKDKEEGRGIKCPVLVICGKKGVVARQFNVLGEWRGVMEEGVDLRVEEVDAGHDIAEEVPDVLVGYVREFFG